LAKRDIDAQLVKYLADVHSIEEQALVQMRRAPDIAGDPEIAEAFIRHLHETERQEQRVREALEARGGSPSKAKDLPAKAGGVGMILFARSQPDTPGKLVAHAYSYEHMELAAYELLGRVADRAGDAEAATLAVEVGEEELAMAKRLEAFFDHAVEASLNDLDPDDLDEQLNKYLADAHAIETQALQLLERAGKAEDPVSRTYFEHRQETEKHEQLVSARLEARGGSPSAIKDAAMRLGGLNWGAFFQAQPDTPAKLAGFAFAFEHLEIGGYELLRRVAIRARDEETIAMTDSILAEERQAAARIAAGWDEAVDSSLEALGVAA
jgi:ferritin-like metal-binding protein YciE